MCSSSIERPPLQPSPPLHQPGVRRLWLTDFEACEANVVVGLPVVVVDIQSHQRRRHLIRVFRRRQGFFPSIIRQPFRHHRERHRRRRRLGGQNVIATDVVVGLVLCPPKPTSR